MAVIIRSQYEICSRPQTVDLLVSLAYTAASNNALEDFPLGMHISLRYPTEASAMMEFDGLGDLEVRFFLAPPP